MLHFLTQASVHFLVWRDVLQQAHHLPRLIRMTISTLGSLDEASEILSYLLFEPNFCRKLIEMGYNDAIDSKKQIEEFFR